MTSSGLYVTRLLAPKNGSTEAECEDAAHVVPAPRFDELVDAPLAVGMSDGATESVLARDWAHLLARSAAQHALEDEHVFRSGPSFESFARTTVSLWEPWLENYIATRAAQGNPLKWYEQTKLTAGASATLLMLRMDPVPGGDWRWRCAALGDSCLFHVRDGKVLRSFPMEKTDEFGVTPRLFNSLNRDTALLSARTLFTEGVCEAGDRLLLMTDALAHWFLSATDHARVLGELSDFSGPHDGPRFSDWLQELRAEGALHNDDVAVVRIDVEGQ
ncbi:protein phosphatase 2C domain-containing protein [Streptomyces sp. NPDC002285]